MEDRGWVPAGRQLMSAAARRTAGILQHKGQRTKALCNRPSGDCGSVRLSRDQGWGLFPQIFGGSWRWPGAKAEAKVCRNNNKEERFDRGGVPGIASRG